MSQSSSLHALLRRSFGVLFFIIFLASITFAGWLNEQPADDLRTSPWLVMSYAAVMVICGMYFWRNRYTDAVVPLMVGFCMTVISLAIVLGYRIM